MNSAVEEQLRAIYAEGNTHLREQTSKRDQVIAAYFVLISFYITNLPALKEFDEKQSLFNGLGIMIFFIGLFICLVLIELRVWHYIYIDTLKITTELLSHSHEYETLEKISDRVNQYYANLGDEKFEFRRFFYGSDNKILGAMFLLVGTTIYFFNGVMKLVPKNLDALMVCVSALICFILLTWFCFNRLNVRRKNVPWIYRGLLCKQS